MYASSCIGFDFLAFASVFFSFSLAINSCVIQPNALTTEYIRNPIAIDVVSPRFSWKLNVKNPIKNRDQMQSAYRVKVWDGFLISLFEKHPNSSFDIPDDKLMWDSGIVNSSESIAIKYMGKKLSSRQQLTWNVEVWDQNGNHCNDSVSSSLFEMGLLEEIECAHCSVYDRISPNSMEAIGNNSQPIRKSSSEWEGFWIRRNDSVPKNECQFYEDDPVPLFRKEFQLYPGKKTEDIKRARVYVSGLGYYILYINGKRVGESELDPGWTSYNHTVLYATFDVKESILNDQRNNTIGLMLGNGWYNPLPMRLWNRLNLRDFLSVGIPTFILQMNIEYLDGKQQSICSDRSWKVGYGPILRNNIYLGEVYDARKEISEWNQNGFNDDDWSFAVPVELPLVPKGALRSQLIQPIKIMKLLKPKTIKRLDEHLYIVDMGINFAGGIRMTIGGPTKANTIVRFRYGELLYANGTLNVRTSVAGQISDGGGGPCAPFEAYQTDTWILKGNQTEEHFRTHFTWHGFQYMEVACDPSCGSWPNEGSIEGLQMYSSVESIGHFVSSNSMFNSIHEISLESLKSNLMSIQSDCPHRERFGYGGDVLASAEMALLNFDMYQIYSKRVRDFADDIRPNGGVTECAPFNGIVDAGLGGDAGPIGWGTVFPALQWLLYRYYGDRRLIEQYYETTKNWVEFIASKAKDFIIDSGLSDWCSLAPKPVALTSTAFFYYNALLLSQMAEVLQKEDDRQLYESLSVKIQNALNREFLNEKTGIYANGTQCSQAFPLYFGLLPKEVPPQNVFQNLVNSIETSDRHFTTGIFGTKYMLNVLSDNGRSDLAFSLLNQTTYPSYGYMLDRGATSLWEVWWYDDSIYSHNHAMFGSVSEWFIKALGGIFPAEDAVAFNKIIIRPQVIGDLEWVQCRYDSVRGPIESNWHINRTEQLLHLEIVIPGNTLATIYLPKRNDSKDKNSYSSYAPYRQTDALHIGSGVYHYVVQWK